MPTHPHTRAQSDDSPYRLVGVAAPFVLAVAALAAGVLWVSTGGGPRRRRRLTDHLSHGGRVVDAARARRASKTTIPSARTAVRAPHEAARHARPTLTTAPGARPAPRGPPATRKPEGTGAEGRPIPAAAAAGHRAAAATGAASSPVRGGAAASGATAAASTAPAAAAPELAGDPVSALLGVGVSRETTGPRGAHRRPVRPSRAARLQLLPKPPAQPG